MEGLQGYLFQCPVESGVGGYRDIAHPITAEARDEIQAVVLAEFEKQTGNSEAVVH